MKHLRVVNTRLSTLGTLSALGFLSILGVLNVSAAAEPQRIVSTAGSLTEIIYALDLQEMLVGVDTTSQWPLDATSLPQVGYQRALSAEGILALAPTIVAATAEAGPSEVLQQLTGAGVRLETFPRDYTLGGLYHRIEQIGEWFEREDEAGQLVAEIGHDFATAQALVVQDRKPSVVFLLGTEAGSAMAAGSMTSAHAMIEYSGGVNALSTYDGYKPVNAEALIEAAPEFLIVVAHGTDNEGHIAESAASLPGVNLTPAGIKGRIIVVDALRFLGFGPRSAEAMLDLVEILHPVPVAQ